MQADDKCHPVILFYGITHMTITWRIVYDYIIFDIEGEISHDQSRTIEQYVRENLDKKHPRVILNIEKVPFINSAALGAIMKLMKDLESDNISFYLMNVNEEIMGLLKMTEVLPFIKIVPGENTLLDKKKKEELDKLLDENPSP